MGTKNLSELDRRQEPQGILTPWRAEAASDPEARSGDRCCAERASIAMVYALRSSPYQQ